LRSAGNLANAEGSQSLSGQPCCRGGAELVEDAQRLGDRADVPGVQQFQGPLVGGADAFPLGLGGGPVAADACRELLGAARVPRGPRADTRANPAGLTARQLEVLTLLCEGLTNAEIAKRLVLSVKTVDHHVSAVLDKLGVDNRHDAVRVAARTP
jgi:DNA-binding CsgD family transcriptional regulator